MRSTALLREPQTSVAGTDGLRQQVPAEVRRLHHREQEQMQDAREQMDKIGTPVARVFRAVRRALMARRRRICH